MEFLKKNKNWMWVETENCNHAKMINLKEALSIEFDIIPGEGYFPLSNFDDFEDSITEIDFFNILSKLNYKENYTKILSEAFNFLVSTKGKATDVEELMEDYFAFHN